MKSRKRILGSARASRAGDAALDIANFSGLDRDALRRRKSDCGKAPQVRAGLALAREARALPRLCRRHQWLALVFCIVVFVGCETANYAPMVSAPRKAEATKLGRGRDLFVHRCIECHTLPAVWKYSREEWPQIVDDMSHRASLKPEDRDTVIAYILAARGRER